MYRYGLKLGAATLLSVALCGAVAFATPLDDYVHAPDDAFSFDAKPFKVRETAKSTTSFYRVVSQKWLNAKWVDRPLWEHWLVVTAPKETVTSTSLLLIGGGSNGDGEPGAVNPGLEQIAVGTKSIVAELRQVPNQPIRIKDEPDKRYKKRGRSEDSLIAYGWDRYLETGDANWLLRLPMTKSAVRAMDVVQQVHPEIESFVVAGASKRGWTAWITAAVDDRVIAVMPLVIDLLNVIPSFNHHHEVYGFWAPAVKDYVDMGLMERRDEPEYAAMLEIIDPLSYVDRLTMPKYIINSAGDQFFLPDSWKFYFDQLKGEKYLRYMPNTDHGLSNDAYLSGASFYNSVVAKTPRPKFSWKQDRDGSIIVECETAPTTVLLWQAYNPSARDFRREEIGRVWESSPLQGKNGIYRGRVKSPRKGWTAYFVEMSFPNPDFIYPFKFTTGVYVTPDTVPTKKGSSRRGGR